MSYILKDLGNDISYRVVGDRLYADLGFTTSDENVCEYRLDQVKEVFTVDSLEVDSKRAEAEFSISEAERIGIRNRRVLIGSAIGAGVDSLSGDDSFIDGLLIGGLFGYAASPGRPARRIPTAHIVISFWDGEKLPLIVDRKAMSILMSVIKINPNGCREKSKILREYNQSEKQGIKETSVVINSIVLAVFAGLICAAFYFNYSESLPYIDENNSDFKQQYEYLASFFWKMMMTVVVWLFSSGVVFLVVNMLSIGFVRKGADK